MIQILRSTFISIKPYYVVLLIALAGISVRAIATPPMAIATVSYLLMLWGYQVRQHQRKFHVFLMSSAMLIDLTLVLILQFQRDAIQTAVGMTLSPLQQLHVLTSTLATVLYFPTATLGTVLYRSPEKTKKLSKMHKKIAVTAFAFRTLGFLLMFSMLK